MQWHSLLKLITFYFHWVHWQERIESLQKFGVLQSVRIKWVKVVKIKIVLNNCWNYLVYTVQQISGSKKVKVKQDLFLGQKLSWFWIWPLFLQIRHRFAVPWTICFIIYCIILRIEQNIANTESYKKQNKNLVCIIKYLLVMNQKHTHTCQFKQLLSF